MTSTSEITPQSTPARAPGALEAEVDGELVLLGPADLGFFGTGGVGEHIWRLIDGTRTVAQLVEELEGAYDAPPGVIRDETLQYLETLLAARLIIT